MKDIILGLMSKVKDTINDAAYKINDSVRSLAVREAVTLALILEDAKAENESAVKKILLTIKIPNTKSASNHNFTVNAAFLDDEDNPLKDKDGGVIGRVYYAEALGEDLREIMNGKSSAIIEI